jgi:molybdopterin/thiamine biosynthesis adenylyltransferase
MTSYPNASLVQRYSRQMLVPQMDGMEGQQGLESSRGE